MSDSPFQTSVSAPVPCKYCGLTFGHAENCEYPRRELSAPIPPPVAPRQEPPQEIPQWAKRPLGVRYAVTVRLREAEECLREYDADPMMQDVAQRARDDRDAAKAVLAFIDAPPPAAPVEAQPKTPGNSDDNNAASFLKAFPLPRKVVERESDGSVYIECGHPSGAHHAFDVACAADQARLIVAALNQFSRPVAPVSESSMTPIAAQVAKTGLYESGEPASVGVGRLREALERIHALLMAMPGDDGTSKGRDIWRLWTDACNIAKSALSGAELAQVGPSEEQREQEAYARFGKEILDQAKLACAEESMGEEHEHQLELAAKLGAGGVRREPYQPGVHQPIDCEPGDLIWSWSPTAPACSKTKEGGGPP